VDGGDAMSKFSSLVARAFLWRIGGSFVLGFLYLPLALFRGLLTSVDYLHGIKSWHLRFDLGGSLTINRSTPADSARSAESVWTLFSEDGAWFSYRNDMRVAPKP
jgi:hypothetical protein